MTESVEAGANLQKLSNLISTFITQSDKNSSSGALGRIQNQVRQSQSDGVNLCGIRFSARLRTSMCLSSVSGWQSRFHLNISGTIRAI